MLCFTEGLFILQMKDLMSMIKIKTSASAFSSSIRSKNTDIVKLKQNMSIILNIYFSKDLDAIVTLQGFHKNFNIDHNCTLSGQSNVPSSISMTSSNASGNPIAPATPMASTPSASMNPAPTAPSQPPSSSSHTCKINDHTKKWVIYLSKPPHSRSAISSTKRSKLHCNTQVPPWKPT